VSHKPQESLDRLRDRVERLQKPSLTSPLYFKLGWPLLAVGVLLWLVVLVVPEVPPLLSILALLLIAAGAIAIAMSVVSAHSEGVEESERARLIRERTLLERCLYLEGNVPDGKGKVGRCRLYDFDMVDLPYCLYCREYTSPKGEPEV
jgi:hypothetical protein